MTYTENMKRRQAWIEGALWALSDQGNEITAYLRAEVEERCPISA